MQFIDDLRLTKDKRPSRISEFRWSAAAGISSGPLFKAINKAGRTWGNGFTPKVIWSIVKEAAGNCGIPRLAPHDLRRYAECRIMPNRDEGLLNCVKIGIILRLSIRHNRGRSKASQKIEELIIRLVTEASRIDRPAPLRSIHLPRIGNQHLMPKAVDDFPPPSRVGSYFETPTRPRQARQFAWID